MYKKPFYLTKNVGNNAFSYKKRKNKKLYITNIKNIKSIDEIKFGDEIVFEDFDFDGNLKSEKGLKNFYKIKWKNKDIYLFDNHNHAYYFWYKSRKKGIIGDNNTLIHIDEHADTRDCSKYLLKPESFDLEKVFKFTNEVLNVGNYILPAQKEGIIGSVIQIRNESNLNDYLEEKLFLPFLKRVPEGRGIILNLDLDFFQPSLDYIDYKLKKKVIIDAAKKAKIITISTSPFFINQESAIKVFKDIFFE